MKENIRPIYIRTHDYAAIHGFEEMAKALEVVEIDANDINRIMEWDECLDVSEMLINLHADITHEEEDALIAAVLLHEYAESFAGNIEEIIEGELGFSDTVCEILEIITADSIQTEEEQQAYYERVQSNKLALLAALGIRANLIQNLHQYSTWNAHRYIDETKACYYPMCIYGKEHYHELLAPISVLMEKMKSIIELAEIMIRRYEARETELMEDILALREENATIRGIIGKFKAGK
ncbi:MAG: hypothetical protein KBS66_04165 [Eubacterium sp.]|nr:hypothetical protein [Candidatus Colimonas fimequi]